MDGNYLLTRALPVCYKYPHMNIRVYNTFTGKKEEFKPLHHNQVRLYVCGVTVYDHCHIGHARSAIVFDVICRYLAAHGYDVISVKNFTDIDDKIINKARAENMPWNEVAAKYIKSFYEDMDALNILRPTYEPKATDHIDDMVTLVETLLKKEHAYQVGGDVYFSVESYKGYGQLSKRTLEEMVAGARVDVNEKKRNPLDFALWKESKEGEPYWETPFGKGRPGWHIECSAMSARYLGTPFDIHGGGKDLIFPHHENERAQTEAATDTKFVNFWVHNGFVNIEREKMSKSLGNILLIKDFAREFHPEVLRLFFLSTHYRNPVDYSERAIEDSNNALHRLYYTLERVNGKTVGIAADKSPAAPLPEIEEVASGFYEAMNDDFNTALALSKVFDLSKILNRLVDEQDESALAGLLHGKDLFLNLADALGILQDDVATFSNLERSRHLRRVGLDVPVLEQLIVDRNEARKAKDFSRADDIRNSLLDKGILLQDTSKGTEWRVRKPTEEGKEIGR
jgi:cysteinyl-tRNA synthetase